MHSLKAFSSHSRLHGHALGHLGTAAIALAAFRMGSSVLLADSANTAAVVSAANTFMAPLTTAQKTAISSNPNVNTVNSSCLYTSSIDNVTVWSNIPVSTGTSGATRNGLIFSGLSTANQTNALAVATAALSTTGKKLLDDVRAADRYISGEVTNAKGSTSAAWGYYKYFIAFVGTPSTTSPFTFQFGGHHLAYNITYNGTYTSGTPLFAGTEPNSWTDSTGTYAPLGALRSILVSGSAGLRQTLTASALLTGTFSDVVFGPNGSGPGSTSAHDTVQPKSYPTSGRGQLYSALTATQQAQVVSYIQTWANYLAPSIANELIPIYTSPQALAETYVGYAGSSTTMAASANYFRVDGPRVWIEFSVQGGVYDMTSYHDHGVFRDKLADYGAAYAASSSVGTTIATTLRPPSINTQPVTQSVTTGGSATFSVAAVSAGTGTATLTYQWYKDGTAISGATSSAYTVSSAAAANAGSYYVTVVSTGGLTTSSVATLTVSGSTAASDAVSSMTVGGVAYDLPLSLSGTPTVECRSSSSGAYQLVVSFQNAVTYINPRVTTGTATIASSSLTKSSEITVNLTGVANAQTMAVTLTVTAGSNTADVVIPMSVLIGDTTGNGVVNSSDVSQTKAQLGLAVTGANVREDVNASGSINSSDVSLVKSLLGTFIP